MRPATDPDADDLVALRARRAERGLLAVLTVVDVVVVFLAALVVAGLRDLQSVRLVFGSPRR